MLLELVVQTTRKPKNRNSDILLLLKVVSVYKHKVNR